MSSIDERIVKMKFDNSQFASKIGQTRSLLDRFKQSMNFSGPTKSLQNLDAAGKRFSLSGMTNGIQTVTARFSALQVAGVTALATIANKAVNVGLQMAQSLTIAPIRQGLQEYETKLGSIQTILANTQAAGTNLQDVNGVLNELNTYADQTIYNFAEMARNIGTFTAAGVDLDTSASAIKGIANLAALSGSNSQQASTAMYQLSQAISAGKVSLMDWNSVVNAGMGGTVFQRSLAETAVAMGTLDESAVKLEGDMKNVSINGQAFRQSISATEGESWLTSDVLTTALGTFTGDLKDAELAAMGFNEAQIKSIQQTAKSAKEAATVVKTGTQLFGTLAEAAGSGWAKTWEIIIGDFEEAKKLWTGVSKAIGGIIDETSRKRNKYMEYWKATGGRDAAIEAVVNSWEALLAVLRPVKEAFRSIFPETSGVRLAHITKQIRDFTEGLKISYETSKTLKRTFKGFFALLDIGWMIVKEVVSTVAELFGELVGGTGSVLEITATFGDFLVAVRNAIKNGEGLTRFFDGLTAVLKVPIKLIKHFAEIIGNAFSNFDTGVIEDGADRIKERFQSLKDLGKVISRVWEGVGNLFKKALEFFGPLGSAIADFLTDFGGQVADAIADMDFERALDLINTGLLAGIFLLFKNFLGGGLIDQIKDMFMGGGGPGIIDTIKDTFGALTDTLGAMQANLNSGTLMKIAGALLMLTVSVVALSMIDSGKLTKALTAITIMFTQLMVAMAILEKITMGAGFAKVPVIAAAMIGLSVAVVILAVAVERLSGLDWNGLAKGLAGVAGLLAAIAVTGNILSKNSGGLVRAGIGMIAVAAAVRILVTAVEAFAGLEWEELAKGLTGVSAVLISLGIFSKLTAASKGAVAQGAGLLILAFAMKQFADSVEEFSGMNWDELLRGLAGFAGVLISLGVALRLMPKNTVIIAAGLWLVAQSLGAIFAAMENLSDMSWDEIIRGLTGMAGALGILAIALIAMTGTLMGSAAMYVAAQALKVIQPVLASFGDMNWDEIIRGLTMLGGTLIILAAGMYAMTAGLPGAAALIVVAGALRIIHPVLMSFADMGWDEIVRGLTMLAGVLAVIGVAGLVLTPVIPALLGLGAAMVLLGIGALGVGAGLMAFSVGLTALAAGGAAATTVLVGMVTALLGLLPLAFRKFGEGIVELANVIKNGAPAIVGALVAVLEELMSAIRRLAPQIADTLTTLVNMLIDVLIDNVPNLINAGMELLLGILKGIRDHIGQIVDVATQIITEFIDGIARNLPQITQAGANLIVTFVESLAGAVRANSGRMSAAGLDLASAIIEGMVSGVRAGISRVADAARNVASAALDTVKSWLGINSPSKEFFKVGRWSDEGLANGMVRFAGKVATAAKGVGNTALDTMKKSLSGVHDAVSGEVDMDPVVRPVLDLSDVKKGSTAMARMLRTDSSYAKASLLSAAARGEEERSMSSVLAQGSAQTPPHIHYEQNITSPKALSEIEIYRQTKNQISTLRGLVV